MSGVGRLTLALVVWAAAAHAQGAPQTRVTLRPGLAKLGERVVYRAEVIAPSSARVRWLPPDSGAAFTWGAPRAGERPHRAPRRRFGLAAPGLETHAVVEDTTWVEIPLQVFQLGVVPIPGARFEYQAHATQVSPSILRAPMTRLVVVPVLSSSDVSATLRPLHGPLAAPWWERVPWAVVTGVLLLVALLVGLFQAWRKRRPATPATLPEPELSPAAAALAALGELRALGLAERGRFAEHAFRLGQILRRYLEATVPTTRPGDTSPELLRHLAEAGLVPEDQRRLAGLLTAWDRVKFAREPTTVEETSRTESAVEGFVRRGSGRAAEEAA